MIQSISILIHALALGVSLLPVNAAEKPNILFILVDDMGWSDLGCYGGETETPHIDSLAKQGVRFNQFYNTAKCMSSRGCLLTGLYAQRCGMSRRPDKLTNAVTLGEVLRPAGYRTWAAGKHHGTENLYGRGFDHYYGLRDGGCNLWNPGVKRPGEPEPGRKIRVRYWDEDAKTYHPFTPTQGVSQLPLLERRPLTRNKPLYWQWTAGGAIRIGEMKAVFWGKESQWELYNLSKDGNESNNLAQASPEMLESMKKKWYDWRASTAR